MPANRETSGRRTNGQFRKGQSGNPAGRPKLEPQVAELIAEYGPVALAELARLSTEASSERTRVAACTEILNRWLGKAPQSIEFTGEDGAPLEVTIRMVDPARASE